MLVDVTGASGRPGEVGRAETDLLCSAEPYIGAIILGRLDIPYHEKNDGRYCWLIHTCWMHVD